MSASPPLPSRHTDDNWLDDDKEIAALCVFGFIGLLLVTLFCRLCCMFDAVASRRVHPEVLVAPAPAVRMNLDVTLVIQPDQDMAIAVKSDKNNDVT